MAFESSHMEAATEVIHVNHSWSIIVDSAYDFIIIYLMNSIALGKEMKGTLFCTHNLPTFGFKWNPV